MPSPWAQALTREPVKREPVKPADREPVRSPFVRRAMAGELPPKATR